MVNGCNVPVPQELLAVLSTTPSCVTTLPIKTLQSARKKDKTGVQRPALALRRVLKVSG
jgi:hypothetical protein